MSREDFIEIWTSVASYINRERLLDNVPFENERFKSWIYDNEVWFLDKATGEFISWYKINHIGRALCYHLIKDKSEDLRFKRFLRDLFNYFYEQFGKI